MIHYFNPGHETAVLNASKHYQPAAGIAKMQEDLAFLPAWYADFDDFVFVKNSLPDNFLSSIQALKQPASAICEQSLFEQSDKLFNQEISLWGISPQSIHFFEKIDWQYHLSLKIPAWKEEFRFLGSRFAAKEIISELVETVPEIEKAILPEFYSDLPEIEKVCLSALKAGFPDRLLLKSPYSSSGRGLVWLPPGKPTQSEKQIISGMLKKQSQVSIEMALDKQLDFSMHFEILSEGITQFTGYSVFQTNAKGVYENSLTDSRENLENRIAVYTGKDLLMQVRKQLTELLNKTYSPYYIGNIGVDMLVYKSGNQFRLHPCVEINMRKSMGYLSIRLYENFIHPGSQGKFFVEYFRNPQILLEKHLALQKQYPLQIESNRICSGYLNLCPVNEQTNYQVKLITKN
ncbi:MAG: hypothetical protein LBT25_13335 [Candidatus Symbiothrix sp.]|jgi:hypothetical protein|nr:hypothetical protein [Candidatus Symbiothrix sp.]